MASSLTIDPHTTPAPRTAHVPRTSGPSLFGIRRSPSLLDLDARIPSEIEAISPMVEQLMHFIEASRCVVGNEFAVELALREALNNAVVYGNQMDPSKSVQLHCRCDANRGFWLIIKDQGMGFDPNVLPDPLRSEALNAEHGRGIYLMSFLMDEVSFECGGTEVHMWKRPTRHSTAESPTSERSAHYSRGTQTATKSACANGPGLCREKSR